ncbi:autotransporter outer membrane beta-barrel domain-containing protein [Mucilaginibacter boryungensis]|uniref:Uncharacterized protein n=1 Tax=Mucilaginibacter boryungensis TaxID=768480 RepID=A0ABR9XLJ7_9SPHI|nr:hypothetical protein [Mucilaginibacter boryungensis]MBE9668252.1 hypothetical protein [Mucilaginibacter boryungensis]
MKKSFLTAMAVISLIPLVSKAQWQGTNPVYFNAGNVGIGITTPMAKLEINDGNGTGVIAYFGANGISNAKGIYFSRPSVNTNPINIQGTLSGIGANDISMQAEGGNVGIGTTSPTSTIQVASFNTSYPAAYFYNYAATGSSRGLIVEGGSNSSDYSSDFRNKTGNSLLFIRGDGNVGMGTTSPNAKLQVYGTAVFSGNTANIDPAGGQSLNYLANSGQALLGWNRTGGRGETDFISNQGAGSIGGFTFYNHNNSNVETELLEIQGNGNVGIGTTDPAGYKLAVNGNIRAKEIKVETGWSDYVFYPTYKLLPLADVAKYIKTNQHLPDVPSAGEVAKNGINVGETNALLLKKIEELTLYLIEKDTKDKEKDEKLIDQQTMLLSQQKEINQLRRQFETLLKKKL